MAKKHSIFKFDVFISNSHQDRKWVHNWLVPKLEEAGLRVWIDGEELQLGAPAVDELERAIEQSRIILFVLTPSFLDSQWTNFESALVEALDPAERQQRVIPLMLKSCDMPLRLRTLTYVDFTRSDQIDFQFRRLLSGITSRETPSRTVPKSTAQTVDYDLSAVRNLLVAAFSDEELTNLCFDHFPGAYEDFSTGMSKRHKIQRLIEYCERHLKLDQLLAIVRERNPAQYSRFGQQ